MRLLLDSFISPSLSAAAATAARLERSTFRTDLSSGVLAAAHAIADPTTTT
jgi:hypothetical protein